MNEKIKAEPLLLDEEQTLDWMRKNLFVLSSKPVNSNASAVGVRPPPGASGNIPHICASGLLDRAIPVLLDFAARKEKYSGIGNETLLKNFCNQVGINPSEQRKTGAPVDPLNPELMAEYYGIAKEPVVFGGDILDKRIKQITLPRNDGTYVTFSPLASAGLCFSISDAIARQDRTAKESEHIRSRQIEMFPVGGSNFLNAGRWVNFMRSPLVFDRLPRKTNTHYAELTALGNRGFKPRTRGEVLKSLLNTLNMGRSDIDSVLQGNIIQARVTAIIQAIKTQAAQKHAIVKRADQDFVGVEEDLRDSLDPVSRGWIFDDLRTHAWRKEAAQDLLRKIMETPLSITADRNKIFLGLNSHEQARLGNLIEGKMKEILK